MPEGLTNYQLNQWRHNFSELKEKMLEFGFQDEVSRPLPSKNTFGPVVFNRELVGLKDLKTIYRFLAAIILLCDIEFQKVEKNSYESVVIKDERIVLKGKIAQNMVTQAGLSIFMPLFQKLAST